MKYVIFDFNGTVVDDVELSRSCINHTISKYLDRKPLTLEEYREVFMFPVKDYYSNVGFDFNKLNWEEVGQCWMNYYLEHFDEARLHDGVKELLIKNHEKGYKNILLSASRIDLLKEQTIKLGVYDYFDEILGLDNIYANSKLPIALNFIKDKDPKECVYLGDSLHDLEVAKAMNVRCLLIAKGHESKRRLKEAHNEVYDSIKEVEL